VTVARCALRAVRDRVSPMVADCGDCGVNRVGQGLSSHRIASHRIASVRCVFRVACGSHLGWIVA